VKRLLNAFSLSDSTCYHYLPVPSLGSKDSRCLEMRHSFLGTSKRPRQVNLSGRTTTNPFAVAATSRHTSSIPSDQTLALAHEERLKRQKDREKSNAARIIQRSWRGYSARHKVKETYREIWDHSSDRNNTWSPGSWNDAAQARPYASSEEFLDDARLLIHFFDQKNEEDIRRLLWLAKRAINSSSFQYDTSSSTLYIVSKLFDAILTALKAEKVSKASSLWLDILLRTIVWLEPRDILKNWRQMNKYYSSLGHVLSLPSVDASFTENPELMCSVLALPLTYRDGSTNVLAYQSFVSRILVIPGLQEYEPFSEYLWARIDRDNLQKALLDMLQSKDVLERKYQIGSDGRIWILTYLIAASPSHQKDRSQSSLSKLEYLFVLANLLGSVADEIATRLRLEEYSHTHIDRTAAGQYRPIVTTETILPLVEFSKQQIMSLADQTSFSNLVCDINQDEISEFTSKGSPNTTSLQYPGLVSQYTLTLLSIFPRKAEEIRLWLYLSPLAPNKDSQTSGPNAIAYLWQAMQHTMIYHQIRNNPRATITIMKAPAEGDLAKLRRTEEEFDLEWSIVILFLELYTFILKVMDDEEFFAGGRSLPVSNGATTRTRQSALTLADVEPLTTFLKNLAFAVHWYVKDLTNIVIEDAGTTITKFFKSDHPQPVTVANRSLEAIGGIRGMDLEHLKGLVTGLLRMVYERE
jgi:ubiquitin-protein ligase E3 C